MHGETELELQQTMEGLLGDELTQLLRDATEALARVAPTQFESIGSRAIDLDTLMIQASAAAALPELMARFRVVSATRRAQSETYVSGDWARDTAPSPAEQRGQARMREVPQDRFDPRQAAASASRPEESPWVR